jgi:hypothetical protein
MYESIAAFLFYRSVDSLRKYKLENRKLQGRYSNIGDASSRNLAAVDEVGNNIYLDTDLLKLWIVEERK